MVSTEQGYEVKPGYLSETIAGIRDLSQYNMPQYEIQEYSELVDSSHINPRDWL
ncbi:L-asparaginase 1, partial [Francisella tularensis subsp. holarctica]|nr:L-asparaginase 1 [Francisella tularensis subsp. holarctica]